MFVLIGIYHHAILLVLEPPGYVFHIEVSKFNIVINESIQIRNPDDGVFFTYFGTSSGYLDPCQQDQLFPRVHNSVVVPIEKRIKQDTPFAQC